MTAATNKKAESVSALPRKARRSSSSLRKLQSPTSENALTIDGRQRSITSESSPSSLMGVAVRPLHHHTSTAHSSSPVVFKKRRFQRRNSKCPSMFMMIKPLFAENGGIGLGLADDCIRSNEVLSSNSSCTADSTGNSKDSALAILTEALNLSVGATPSTSFEESLI